METKLKYKRIKSEEQYHDYLNRMEELDMSKDAMNDIELEDEIELIQLLIEDYEEKYIPSEKIHPSEIIKLLLTEHGKTASDFAKELNISKSVISEILSEKRAISKELAYKISQLYKIRLEKLLGL